MFLPSIEKTTEATLQFKVGFLLNALFSTPKQALHQNLCVMKFFQGLMNIKETSCRSKFHQVTLAPPRHNDPLSLSYSFKVATITVLCIYHSVV